MTVRQLSFDFDTHDAENAWVNYRIQNLPPLSAEAAIAKPAFIAGFVAGKKLGVETQNSGSQNKAGATSGSQTGTSWEPKDRMGW